MESVLFILCVTTLFTGLSTVFLSVLHSILKIRWLEIASKLCFIISVFLSWILVIVFLVVLANEYLLVKGNL